MNQQLSLIPDQLVAAQSGEPPDLIADRNDLPRGLLYQSGFISVDDEERLLSQIDMGAWLEDIARRVQQYGFKYDYSNRRIDDTNDLGPLPSWLADLEERTRESLPSLVPGFNVGRRFDQAIVNDYQPGQGIAPHTDRSCFGPLIATVSLGSDVNMDFINSGSQSASTQRIETRSLLALSGDARSVWRHGIAKRKSDLWMGSTVRRHRRVSITFRTVL